jgi:anaerobic ribonucleoside-triphosphate reductase activating protein
MNYAEIKKFDAANGPGVRTALFVSGCKFNCEGCFNKEIQDFNYGELWTNEVEDQFIEHAKNPVIDGVSILGGEPMMQDSETMLNLVKRLRTEVNKPIWVWTGYKIEVLLRQKDKVEILKEIDVLIDGQFIIKLKDLSLKYRGSSNQRVIDVKQTLKNKKITLLN